MIIERPETEIKIEIKESVFVIKYPTSGQMIDIAVLKAKLSDNQYSSLYYQSSIEAPLALRLIDVYSFLTIAAPKVKETLTKKSFYELEAAEAIELVHVYEKQILPWYNKWTEYINNRMSELKGEENSKANLI